jgi:hypothetical protein
MDQLVGEYVETKGEQLKVAIAVQGIQDGVVL